MNKRDPFNYSIHEYQQDADSWGWRVRALFQVGIEWGTADLVMATSDGLNWPTERGRLDRQAEVLAKAEVDGLLDWYKSEELAREIYRLSFKESCCRGQTPRWPGPSNYWPEE